jgi:two-component system response regulator FlrC
MNETILIVEDDADLQEALKDTLELSGYQCLVANDGQAALAVLEKTKCALIISDVQMQPMDGTALLREVKIRYTDTPILLMTAYATVQQAVNAMQIGALDYLVKPFDSEVLVHKVSECIPAVNVVCGMVAIDPASIKLKQLTTKVAVSDATVLITGPSGSGKEVVANYIHQQSSRSEKPFVAINCAAIPDNMLEAVLFGYEKGAFTGAYKSSPGKFEQAQGGTILLDEISEMELGLQAKLLRVLQEREVERLGSQTMIPLDVRVLATSNRNMREQISEGLFREDLFYRLNVFPLDVLPLRDRTGDIVPLADFMIKQQCLKSNQAFPSLDKAAQNALIMHAWPGNVRELDNIIQRALILKSGNVISINDLHFETDFHLNITEQAVSVTPDEKTLLENESTNLGSDMKNREIQLIEEALKETHGNKKNAAEKLGISPRTLRYKLQKFRESGMRL